MKNNSIFTAALAIAVTGTGPGLGAGSMMEQRVMPVRA